MPDTSPKLNLPYLSPSQAQKHVTHNEALQLLDLLAQLVVEEFDATLPPVDPSPGAVWALGASPLSAWAGQGDTLAAWTGTGWLFVQPAEGWLAWGRTEEEMRIWRGAEWGSLQIKTLEGLGIGTSFDATNRLTVASAATLLTHAGAGHQVKINKAAEAETASLLYQTNFSGRAEMGLTGDDDFSVKVSANGTTWFEALIADRTTGTLRLPQGARLADGTAALPALGFATDPDTGLYRDAENQIGFVAGGVKRASLGPAELQLNVPMTGSAVTQNPLDVTAGRLMKVGDFGLGGLSPAVNAAAALDAITTNQTVRVSSGDVATVGGPSGALAGVVDTYCNIAGYSFQEYREVRNNSGASFRLWRRGRDNGVWGPWQQIYQQGSILGTVSQSGGVPTGAVMERGSNANGEYVRFADGTQICSGAVTNSTAGVVTAPFAAVFASAAVRISNTVNADLPRICCTSAITATSFASSLYNTAGARQNNASQYIAVGRWF